MDRLRVNNALLRRHYIRRVLIEEWQAGRGVKTVEDIILLVRERYGLGMHERGVRTDLDAMHAVKIEQAGYRGTFWIVPPWRMDMQNVARLADQETVLNEVQHRLNGYAMDSVVLGARVFINTDRHCGRMVGEWIALLDWPEIGHVVCHDHSVEILCLNDNYAALVHAKLLGDMGVLILPEERGERLVRDE